VLLIAVAVAVVAAAVAVREAAPDMLVIQAAAQAFEVPRLHSSMAVNYMHRFSHRRRMKWDAVGER